MDEMLRRTLTGKSGGARRATTTRQAFMSLKKAALGSTSLVKLSFVMDVEDWFLCGAAGMPEFEPLPPLGDSKPKRMWPDDGGLKPAVRKFEDTFSVWTVIKETWFPHLLTDKEKEQLGPTRAAEAAKRVAR